MINIYWADRLRPGNITSIEHKDGFTWYHERYHGSTLQEFVVPDGVDLTSRDPVKGPFFECLKDPPGVPRDESRIQCRANVQLNDRLFMDYVIPKNRLEKWPAVDARMRELVASFVVDCFGGKVPPEHAIPDVLHPCPH